MKSFVSIENIKKVIYIYHIVHIGKQNQSQIINRYNRYIPILNRVAKWVEGILRYHKISLYTLNTQ